MKHTSKEYELQADAILATLEYIHGDLNEFVTPNYFVAISKTGLSARFECHYTDEDRRDDKHTFTLLKSDKLSKLISNIEDNYHSLKQIDII